MLLSAENIVKSYSEKVLLNGISLYINEGDKIGVIGVNGTGKSTLLKILAQVEESDSGTVSKANGLKVEYLHQNPVWDNDNTIIEHIFSGTARALKNVKEYEAKAILTKLGITEFEKPVGQLSGGQKKRVAIAAALIHPCDVLILDEPTNHLDNEMVVWLEGYLIKYTGALVMVTHDRYFLERVTNKIVEIDSGNLYTYQANYSKYLELKSQREEMELGTQRKRRSLLRKELEWIQRGARARGTKSKSRIARFEELSDSIADPEASKLEISSMASRLGKKTVEINNISKCFGETTFIKNFDHIISRDARIGVVGKNGCGKSTLLNIIAGKMLPDSGSVVWGETVKLAYFTQDSDEMDLSLKVIDYIKSISGDIKTSDGLLSASQMLEKFLFSPDLQYNTISRLSGGERRRLYLLSIIMEAPNILLLDEPTNDLDIQTLTILEDYLENFNGAVIAVSHDRYFLDKVVDTIFEFQGDGKIRKCLGGYSDYLAGTTSEVPEKKAVEAKPAPVRKEKSNKKLKFTFNEQREFETIDTDIAELEEQVSVLTVLIDTEASDYVKLQENLVKKEALEKKLEEKMERWVCLHDMADIIAGNEN